MKKIIPFNNVLSFSTDVCEITAISLEHKVDIGDDSISGVFDISGEYKITDGQLEREKFSFELPFDIALGNNYDRSTLVVDIDDFRYEIVDRNKLKVNIDLYIDGEVIPVVMEEDRKDNVDDMKDDLVIHNSQKEDNEEITPVITNSKERIDLLEEMLDNDKEIEMKEEKEIKITNENNNNIENNNENIDIFNGINSDDGYVTYRVYRVMEGDTIDKIIEKYNTTKEELEKYNDLGDIKIGDKLIILANDK